MKKEISKWTTSIEEVSIKEAINEFFAGDWNPTDWEDTEEYIDSYIENDLIEITDEEEDYLKAEIKKEYDKRVSELRQEEIIKLKDKDSILKWIENSLNGWIDEGEIGYLLSAEEVLNLILQNGNK